MRDKTRRSYFGSLAKQKDQDVPGVSRNKVATHYWTACVSVAVLLLLPAASNIASADDRVFPLNDNQASRQRLKRSVAYLASLSVEKMSALVPVQSGIFYTDCPNCDIGTQDRGHFEWNPERPRQIECTDCGAVYPGHVKYPDVKAIEVEGPDGAHYYPYYERPGDNYRIYFQAHADYRARKYMADKCRDFARLYALIGDDDYAQRAAAILVRFAEVYPGYAYRYDYPFRKKIIQSYKRDRVPGVPQYRTARWYWWAYGDISLDLVEAYEHIESWPELKVMKQGRAAEMVRKDLLGAMCEFVLGFEETYSNMSPGMWRSVILAGRVLKRPVWVHEAVRRFEHFLDTRFLYDGHWMETAPSYGAQVLGGVRAVIDAAQGYSDPPGYTDATDGRHFRKLDLAKDTRQYHLAEQSLLAPRLPDGRLIPVNDTWAGSRRSAREKTEPVLLPALGVAVIGSGQGNNQYHAHLNFTSGRHHKHKDALSLGLFAFGNELFPDIGYTHTKYRCWATSTMSHNTVVVNGLESQMDSDWSGNRLRTFVNDGRGFQLVDVESRSAYEGVTDRYRRVVIAVGGNASDCYLIDIFQVSGGTQHDYLLHGSADEGSIARIFNTDSSAPGSGPGHATSPLLELDLSPFQETLLNRGVEFVPPKGESNNVGRGGAYGFVHSLKSAEISTPVALDIQLENAPTIGTRTWLLPEPGTKVFLGQAPSIRRARESDSALEKYQSPFFCARRQGSQLKSLFVAVHEVYNGAPALTVPPVVTRVGGVVYVVIDRGKGRRDYVLVATEDAATEDAADWTRATPDGKLSVLGRYSLVRTRDGEVVEAHLVGGRRLALNDFALVGDPAWKGKLSAVERAHGDQTGGYFEVSEVIPETASDQTLTVTHADGSVQAYNVVRLESMNGSGTRLYVREDPGFQPTDDGNTKTTCYPQRTIAGTPRGYELLNAVHWYQSDSP